MPNELTNMREVNEGQNVVLEAFLLPGIFRSTRKLSRSWHNKQTGYHIYGAYAKYVHHGYPVGNYFGILCMYPNLFDQSNPLIKTGWPIPEKEALRLREKRIISPQWFYRDAAGEFYKGGMGGNPKGLFDVLYGLTKEAVPLIRIEKLTILKEDNSYRNRRDLLKPLWKFDLTKRDYLKLP